MVINYPSFFSGSSLFRLTIPQRSSLGPLFFLIYINNLSNNIIALVIKRGMYMLIHQLSWNRGPSNSTESVFLD